MRGHVDPTLTEPRHRRRGGQSGSIAVESVIVIPAAMLIVLLAVQVCLWAHASSLVQSAADAGEQAATALGGSPATGQATARGELAQTARSLVLDASVRVQVQDGQVQIQVSGRAESIVPWLTLPVSATRTGLVQEFRESG